MYWFCFPLGFWRLIYLFFFFKIFWCGTFKSFCWICYNNFFYFMFWFFDNEACGIPDQACDLTPSSLNGEVSTTRTFREMLYFCFPYIFLQRVGTQVHVNYMGIFNSQILFSQYINLGKFLFAKQSIKQNSCNSCLLSSILFFLYTCVEARS